MGDCSLAFSDLAPCSNRPERIKAPANKLGQGSFTRAMGTMPIIDPPIEPTNCLSSLKLLTLRTPKQPARTRPLRLRAALELFSMAHDQELAGEAGEAVQELAENRLHHLRSHATADSKAARSGTWRFKSESHAGDVPTTSLRVASPF